MYTISFIPIKRFAGNLLISQRRHDLRSTLTTKEFVFQRPHTTYYILLEQIVGIVPYSHPFGLRDLDPEMSRRDLPLYKITTRELHVITRNGYKIHTNAELIIPIHTRLLRHLNRSSDFTQFL